MTCECGRYEWPNDHGIGLVYCEHCGMPVSLNATDHGDEPRTYYCDAERQVWLTEDAAMMSDVEPDEQQRADPVTMRPSEFAALTDWSCP